MQVEVVEVHTQDGAPYYTVRMPDGAERQTEQVRSVTLTDRCHRAILLYKGCADKRIPWHTFQERL